MAPKAYYLDTNVLYSLGRIQTRFVDISFTSALAILELIAGLHDNPERFKSIKSVLQRVQDLQLSIEWILPQRLLYDTFDVSKHFKLVDPRPDMLRRLAGIITACHSFDDFVMQDQAIFGDSGLQYVASVESKWAGTLMRNFSTFQNILKQSFRDKPEETLVIGGNTYETGTKKQFENAMRSEFETMRIVTIQAFTQDFLTGEFKPLGLSKTDVVSSYNGLVDHFVDAHANYMLDVSLGKTPSQNDTVDLLHLTYLRNCDDVRIVSDDKIFDKYSSHKRIKSRELL